MLTLNEFHKQQTNIITLTSLQLHHNTYIIKLTSITSLHFNYITCSNLITSSNSITSYALIISPHHSPHYNYTTIPPVTIHLRISTGTRFPHSLPTFLSPFQIFVPISISNDIWDTSKLLLLSGDGKTNLRLRPIDENPVFFLYALQNLFEVLNKIRLLCVQRLTVMYNGGKPAMV